MLALDPDPIPEAPLQRTLACRIREQSKIIITSALLRDTRALTWWQSGSYRNAGSWMRITPLKALTLDAPEYRTALSLRLLLPARGAPDGTYLQCTVCGQSDKAKDYRYHALNCTRTCAIRTARHTAIKRALAEMLTKILGSAAVSMETPLGPGLRVPDITLELGTRTTLIDVAVVNPAADRYSRDTAPLTECRAAGLAEHRKRLSYASSLATRGLAPESLVPFVIEATGRFGTAAQSFLDALPTMVPADRAAAAQEVISFYSARLRIITHKGNNQAFTAHNPHLQTYLSTADHTGAEPDAEGSSESLY